MTIPNQHRPLSGLQTQGYFTKQLGDNKSKALDGLSDATSPDRALRSSFSSIREQHSDLAQTFTSSHVSSYFAPEDAVEDSSPVRTPGIEGSAAAAAPDMAVAYFHPPTTRPNSKLHGYWSPADSFTGWKQINVRGKYASRSFGDLQALNVQWKSEPKTQKRTGVWPAGESPLEQLPVEILSSVIDLLVLDVPPNGVTRRNVDLMSMLLTSRTLHSATLNSLYQHVTIPHSRIFHKFLQHVLAHPALGTIVRRLDFCHFNPSQLFSTAAERSQARNLTSETLLQCLELTPYLQEFLAQEYIDDDLDAGVLRKLFLGLPRLRAVDFCGCSSAPFRDSFSAIITPDWPAELSISRLSLHKCLTLPSSILEVLLPRLPKLTHLDVAGTRITDAALASVPKTARITHLNLAKCTLLSAEAVIDFLTHHPAARELVFLSVATDAMSHQLLGPEDLNMLLPILPKTLKSLSLKGNKMLAHHIDMLLPLTKHLEELAIGRGLRLPDYDRLFVPDSNDVEKQLAWTPHTLCYIDFSDLWGSELDVGFLFGKSCSILSRFSEPLEVVEITDIAYRRLPKLPRSWDGVAWRTSEVGSRTWLVRTSEDSKNGAASASSGHRSWKMGAEAWGMRKIPVAKAEVGGMYGSFMFSRKL